MGEDEWRLSAPAKSTVGPSEDEDEGWEYVNGPPVWRLLSPHGEAYDFLADPPATKETMRAWLSCHLAPEAVESLVDAARPHVSKEGWIVPGSKA